MYNPILYIGGRGPEKKDTPLRVLGAIVSLPVMVAVSLYAITMPFSLWYTAYKIDDWAVKRTGNVVFDRDTYCKFKIGNDNIIEHTSQVQKLCKEYIDNKNTQKKD